MGPVLAVFAKAPRPGTVKTRLTPPLLPEVAANFYAAMLADTLRESTRAGDRFGFAVVLFGYPEDGLSEMLALAPAGVLPRVQRGEGLGRRMAMAADELFAAGYGPVVIRGSDSPGVTMESLGDAFAALASADVVLGPDRDGGYHLVGLARPEPRIFEVPMSTPRVFQATEQRVAQLGLRCAVQAPGFDVDTVEDLVFLRSCTPTTCRETLAFADRHDLWRHLNP